LKISPKYQPESQLCRVLMTLRGIDEFEMARRCECNVSTIRNLLADAREYPALKAKVERCLQFKIWSHAGTTTTQTPVKTMNAETHTLPEKLEPFREQIVSLHAAKTKLSTQLQENDAKHTLAIHERDMLSQSDPSEETTIPKLTEAQVKVQLFENHSGKLSAAIAETTRQAALVTAGFGRELQKIAVTVEREGRERMFTEIAKLIANSPEEIAAAFNGGTFTPRLVSHEEMLARVLKLEADYKSTDRDPFDAFDQLVEVWEEFYEAYNAAQSEKREPITA
jgi:hypothetical protein